MKRRHLIPLLIATLGVGLTAGFWWPRDDDFFVLKKNFDIFGQMYEELITQYVDPVDATRLMRSGLDAMLADLDPYTVYFDEGQVTDARIQVESFRRSQYGSVGLGVEVQNGEPTVVAPHRRSSGFRQGVRPGDVLLKVNGQDVSELSGTRIMELLDGPPNTTAEVELRREGEPEPLTFSIPRVLVDLESLSYTGFVNEDTSAGIGYVKLDQFGMQSHIEVTNAVRDLVATESLNGLVLDLRDNLGGVLQSSVVISGLFLPKDSVVVSMRGRDPGSNQVYRNENAPIAPDVPLVVLVNDLSASASEIVAGALQDYDRAIVLGDTTYGKGLVQVVRSLPYNTSLKLTTARYYTPTGRSIQALDYGQQDGSAIAVADRRAFRTANGRTVYDGHGIEPDVLVTEPPANELETALRRRAAFFYYANHYAATHEAPPAEVDDAILRDFQQWLEAESFTYETTAQQRLDLVAGDLEAAGYQAALSALDDLRDAVNDAKTRDFAQHADRLKALLREEIMARYLDPEAYLQDRFHHDPQMIRALELLGDDGEYRSIIGA
ncbi:MAG: S41 family peptidase [Rhodothermales bacterium]